MASPVTAEDLAELTLAKAPRLGSTRLLSIDGRAGSGKTTLGVRAAQALAAPVLHLDDFYPGWDGLAEGVRRLRTDVLEPLRDGRPGAYRRWDWHVGARTDPRPVPVTPVLVIEGVGASVATAGLSTLSVWVEVSATVRRARALTRDGDVFAPHWDAWAAQEESLFACHPAAAGAAAADLVIDNNEERQR